jgi:hypothetical protein
MQTPSINPNVSQALQIAASDVDFARALGTYFPADTPADVIRDAVISSALQGLWQMQADAARAS